jgi:thiol-disulfide isomerase/thioredoxin
MPGEPSQAGPIRTVRAPELARPGIVWLNTPRPLSLAELRGRLVILDFWTSSCINCLQLQPTLAELEARFGDRIAVIGVHSPKFAAERGIDKLAAAIQRYGVAHPVAQDVEFTIWRQYAVRAWPTLVLISADGYVLGSHAGEPDRDRLIETVDRLLAAAPPTALPDLPRAPASQAAGRLRFPGKLAAIGGGWALCDSGHHQIVLLTADGAERARFGSGAPGLADGPAAAARFTSPQGLALQDEALIVADTGNHALRRIDLASGAVTTLAGDGRRDRPLVGPASDVALASPWDVAVLPRGIAFANAGTHQLGLFDPAARTVARLAGSGREGLLDGPAEEAALAQPSALVLAADGRSLYFLDSETSALRRLDLDTNRVASLIGSGLFDFGHENGAFAGALLQHPLALALDGTRLYIADSYNDTVRVAELGPGRIADLDDGFLCQAPLCRAPSEPAGIALAGDRLLLADSNSHRILAYDLPGRTVRTWAE